LARIPVWPGTAGHSLGQKKLFVLCSNGRYEVNAREECQHYIVYVDAGKNFFGNYGMVRPRYRGAQFHLALSSRKCALLEKKKIPKFAWYEFFAGGECHHYISYLVDGGKKYAKYGGVRSRYRGAHSYLTFNSRIFASSKKNKISKFSWYELLAREECHHCIGYLDDCVKKLAKLCMVRSRYRGAHHYPTRTSSNYAYSKKNNFSKFAFYECLARKECHQYFVCLCTGKENLAKYCMVRPRYRGAHYYLIRISRCKILAKTECVSNLLSHDDSLMLFGCLRTPADIRPSASYCAYNLRRRGEQVFRPDPAENYGIFRAKRYLPRKVKARLPPATSLEELFDSLLPTSPEVTILIPRRRG